MPHGQLTHSSIVLPSQTNTDQEEVEHENIVTVLTDSPCFSINLTTNAKLIVCRI